LAGGLINGAGVKNGGVIHLILVGIKKNLFYKD
jgi:hypothetical protein